MPPIRRTRLAVAVGVCGLAAGAALTAYVLVANDADAGITPAKASGTPHCHRIADRAPASLGGHSRRDSSLPGVAVWGDQDIVLRCGVTPPGPTGDPCFAVDGVDWVYDEAQSTHGRKVVVTYGRSPATQVVFDAPGRTDEALVDLSRLVAPVKQTAGCLSKN